jgi:hypothetical protein
MTAITNVCSVEAWDGSLLVVASNVPSAIIRNQPRPIAFFARLDVPTQNDTESDNLNPKLVWGIFPRPPLAILPVGSNRESVYWLLLTGEWVRGGISGRVAARMRGRAEVFFVVTYDLRSGRNRSSLFKTLRSFGRWSHFMASGWIISTRRTHANITARLLSHLDPEDSICIMPLEDTHAAYLPQRAANWVAAQQQLTRKRARRVVPSAVAEASGRASRDSGSQTSTGPGHDPP